MGFLEALALVGTAATILGVFLTAYAMINNKILKKESKLTREAIAESQTSNGRRKQINQRDKRKDDSRSG
ncbi:MAG: hypothetical protein QME81_08275 [bacterium]|nr:hypothetical protein [bacterium]